MQDLVVGVDLGATKILTGVITSDGQVLSRTRVPTPTRTQPALDYIAQAINQLIGSYPQDKIKGIVVATPGPLSYPDKVVMNSPNLKWKNIPLQVELEKRLERKVIVEKDTNLAALGEYYFGQQRRHRHLIYITVSTGIGGGLVLDGRLYRGSRGGGGEIGHMVVDPGGRLCGCGRRGCLEAVASGTALQQEVSRLIAKGKGKGILACTSAKGKGSAGAREVGEAARVEDPEALAIIERTVKYLATGIANLVNAFNPEIVVLGGGVAQGLKDLLLEPVTRYVKDQVFPLHGADLRIDITRLGEDIGLYGCAAAVLLGEN